MTPKCRHCGRVKELHRDGECEKLIGGRVWIRIGTRYEPEARKAKRAK